MRELLNEWALLMVTAFILRRQESGENPPISATVGECG